MLSLLNANRFLDWFATLSLWQAVGVILIENIFVFVMALLIGEIILRGFIRQRVALEPDPISPQEMGLALSTVILNTVVTLTGWQFWKMGWIVIRRDTDWHAWVDALILVVAMDLAMYFAHRIAHIRWLYPIAHRTHHLYDKPRPLDLFVLSPLEVLGFGGMWIMVIMLYHSSWLGMAIYLSLNAAFGTLGHLGVEPFPVRWVRLPLLKHIGTSTFHARHHQDGHHNFGFYTDLWDRVFGTLEPDYEANFGRLPPNSAHPESST